MATPAEDPAIEQGSTELQQLSHSHTPSGETTEDQENNQPTDGPGIPNSDQTEAPQGVCAKFVDFFKNPERKWSVGIASLVAALPGFLLGLTLGYPSNVILDLTGEATELPEDFFFSSLTLSLFAAFAPLGAIPGGPFGGWIADRWGRWKSMMFCGVPYLLGYLMLSFVHYLPTATAFFILLMTGRFLTGIGMGWASAVSPVYTGELCSKELSGIYGNIFPIFLTSGILFNYALGAIDIFRYYYISLVAVGIVLLFEVLMFWLPETPKYLVPKDKHKAEKVLLWLRGRRIDIEMELAELQESLSETQPNGWRVFLELSVFLQLVVVLVIFMMQQGGGINAITPFAGTILMNAGMDNPRATAIYAVGGAGIVGLLGSIILIKPIGNGMLLTISGIGQLLGVTLLGVHAFITRPSLCNFSSAMNYSMNYSISTNFSIINSTETVDTICNPQFKYMALFGIIFFVLLFTIGYNSVPFILLAELLPLSVRGKASGIASAVAWGTAAAFSGLYFIITDLITPWWTLWSISIFDMVVVLFVAIMFLKLRGKLSKFMCKNPAGTEL